MEQLFCPVTMTVFPTMAFTLRKGFLSAGIPVFLKGIKGPGAPYVFEMSQRNLLGLSGPKATWGVFLPMMNGFLLL